MYTHNAVQHEKTCNPIRGKILHVLKSWIFLKRRRLLLEHDNPSILFLTDACMIKKEGLTMPRNC
jgi:hypothetical protein